MFRTMTGRGFGKEASILQFADQGISPRFRLRGKLRGRMDIPHDITTTKFNVRKIVFADRQSKFLFRERDLIRRWLLGTGRSL